MHFKNKELVRWGLILGAMVLAGLLFSWQPAEVIYSKIINYSHTKTLYWIIAFGWSMFLGTYAFQLHSEHHAESSKEIFLPVQIIHQGVFNFLGAIVGWVILYFFIWTNNFHVLAGWEKLLLLTITFLSIVGYLPYILIKYGLPWHK